MLKSLFTNFCNYSTKANVGTWRPRGEGDYKPTLFISTEFSFKNKLVTAMGNDTFYLFYQAGVTPS